MINRLPVIIPKFSQIVTALPGYYVLEALSEDNGYPTEVHKYPVVAWALEEETYAPYPITLEGIRTTNDAILQPDGTVERPCLDWSPDIDQWLKWEQSSYLDEHPEKAASSTIPTI